MTPSALNIAISALEASPADLFKKASLISRFILENGSTHRELNQHVIKLHAAVLSNEIGELLPITNGLLREVGLFPYLADNDLDWRDQFAVEAHRVDQESETSFVFHRAQFNAFHILKSGRSLVLSAPTSFGKSFLIDALISANRPNTVVLIVPTLALLDEQRRRLERNFRDHYRVIYRNDQDYDESNSTIFVLTQERLMERSDLRKLDLLIVDEFYKLNADIKDTRSRCLNIVFRKYSSLAGQVFMLGPNLDVQGDWDSLRAVRLDTDAATVATSLHDFTEAEDKPAVLREVLSSRRNEKTIVFCKSPASCRRLAKMLSDSMTAKPSDAGKQFGQWISEKYHPEWIVARSLLAGIGMHHGAMPRGVSQQMLRFFDDSDLNVLLCTSTLIEGVNTKAENIVIYDNKIRSKNIDYFSYKNISGRAGRFGKYMIGNIFVFNSPPEPSAYQLEIPGLADVDELDEEYLIGVDGFATEERFSQQRLKIESRLELPAELIAKLATFPIDSIESAAENVLELVELENGLFVWSGQCEYQQLVAALELGWREFAVGSQLFSANQAAFFAFRMLSARGNIREYLERFADDSGAESLQRELDQALRAIRDVEFYVPTVLSAVQVLVNYFRVRTH